jgi:alpha-1,3-mannosyltransferase
MLLLDVYCSVAVSIKMNVLLFLPPYMLLVVKAQGLLKLVAHLVVMAMWQVAVGVPFLQQNWWSYLVGSFNFGRKFFFIWTVNWKVCV